MSFQSFSHSQGHQADLATEPTLSHDISNPLEQTNKWLVWQNHVILQCLLGPTHAPDALFH